MPATSPYQNNDYQAASTFRPFNLPINDIFKASVAQNEFWEQGARRVKSAYDNALGMSLTLDENKAVRDQFIKDADKSITKLSQMNLGDPSVQRQGLGIFQPLFSDKSIAIDNQLTKLKQGILQNAESFKNKKLSENGRIGEGYNTTNLMDALDGFEEFNSKSPRNQGYLEQMYQKLGSKAYQPYYDYGKEMKDITKNCKGVTTQSAGLDQGYITTTTQSGAESDRLRECLSYGLSDAAQNQIAIEGRRAFKNGDNSVNYRAMTDMYNSKYTQSLHGLTRTDQDLLADRALYEKYYSETGDDKYKKALDFIDKQRSNNQERIDNLVEGYQKLNTGDPEYLKTNYSKLAEGIYKNSLIDGFAQAYESKSVKTDLKADPFEMLKYRLSATYTNDVALENLKFEHEKVIKSMEKKKGGNAEEDALIPINPAQVEGDIITNGIAEFTAKQEANSIESKNLTTELYNGNIKKQWEAGGGSIDGFFNTSTEPKEIFGKVYQPGQITDAGLRYLNNANLMNDPSVTRYLDVMSTLSADKQVMDATWKSVENDKSVLDLGSNWRDKIAKFEPVNINGVTITGSDVQNALEGKSSVLKIEKGSAGYTTSSPTTNISSNTGYTPDRYYVNGALVESTYGTEGNVLHQLVRKVYTGDAENTNAIINRKNELLGQALIAQEGRVQVHSRNTDKEDPVRLDILKAVRTAAGPGVEMEDVLILDRSPKTGRATVQVTKNLAKGASFPKDEDMLSSLSQSISAEKSRIHKSLSPNTLVFDITDPRLVEDAYKGNRFSTTEDNLSQLATVLKTSPESRNMGERIENRSIFVTSPRNNTTKYAIVPYKNSAGNIVFELRIESRGDAKIADGTFVKYKDGLTTSEVISKINN